MTVDPLAWIALALTIGVCVLVAVVILVANEVAVYRRSRRGGVVDLTGISAYGYRAARTRPRDGKDAA